MSLEWWQLPGTRGFLENAIEDLRDGKNVVLCLPPHAPRDLRRALRETWQAADERFYMIDLNDYDGLATRPLDLLFHHFLPDAAASELRDTQKLLSAAAFERRIIWLNSVNGESHSTWCDFLQQYQHASRNSDFSHRNSVFIVPLTGNLAIQPPPEDVRLVKHEWRGVVDSLDALLYAATLYREKSGSRLRRKIAVALIANLALWDLSLAERLADESFNDLLDPKNLLASIAAENGWSDKALRQWHCGMIDEIDGAQREHSALVACGDDGQQLSRRLWNAQVAVLLPFVEERRQELLLEYADVLPFWLKLYGAKTSVGEIISDVGDLEIGNLCYLFKQAGVIANCQPQIEDLREIRNELAHLRPVKSEILQAL